MEEKIYIKKGVTMILVLIFFVYSSYAKTSCTIAFTMLKGRSFCWMAGMVILYSVPCRLNFGIRRCTVAMRLYGNCGFAIACVGSLHN